VVVKGQFVAAGYSQAPCLGVMSSLLGKTRLSASGLKPEGGFGDYLAGSVKAAGLEGQGLNIYVNGTLPLGSGLSSSASLLVASMACLWQPQGRSWTQFEAAEAAQKAENEFVALQCGFMDQV